MKAPRHVQGLWRHLSRGALLGLGLWLPSAGAAGDHAWKAQQLVRADYSEPTDRYPHAVLGDAIEYGSLVLTYSAGLEYTIRLPEERVFEDIAPRLIDVDGDGKREAVVVESHRDMGARLAIYNGAGVLAATPYIGTRFRWLAPIGAADLDGDGAAEIAYIDRPHLAKRLRLWRFRDGELVHVADKDGLTNHRVGEGFISGGVRDCDGRPELITANANWTQVMATVFDGTTLTSHALGPFSQKSMDRALNCP